MKLRLDGLKSCYISDLQLVVIRGQEFECPDNIVSLLLAQDGRFSEVKEITEQKYKEIIEESEA